MFYSFIIIFSLSLYGIAHMREKGRGVVCSVGDGKLWEANTLQQQQKAAREGYGIFLFFSLTVVYEILLDKYWGSIDTRKEGFYFFASQAEYHVLVGLG